MSRLARDIHLDAVASRLSFSPPPRRSRRRRRRGPARLLDRLGGGSRPSRRSRRSPGSSCSRRPPPRRRRRGPARPSPWTTSLSSFPSRPPWHAAPASALYPVLYVRPAMAYARCDGWPCVCRAVGVLTVSAAGGGRGASRELVRRSEAQLRMQQQQRQAWAAASYAAAAQPQLLRLYTVEGKPAGYKTKWEELHPVSQELLLQIEYGRRSESTGMIMNSWINAAASMGFELDACQITQEIGSISTIMDREKASMQNLMAVVRKMMCSTDFAIHSYVKLRPRFVRRSAEIANAGYANCAGSSGTFTDFNQPLAMAPTFHCYHGAVRRPSLFMQNMVARFENQLEECCKLIGELKQLVQMKNDKTYPDPLQSLPKVMSNMHDYLIHVAAKVDKLYQYAQTMITHYLSDQRPRGNWNDPFLEADRREAAKKEAAARNIQFSSRCKNTW